MGGAGGVVEVRGSSFAVVSQVSSMLDTAAPLILIPLIKEKKKMV